RISPTLSGPGNRYMALAHRRVRHVVDAGGDPRAEGEPIPDGGRGAVPDPLDPDVEARETRRSEGEAGGRRAVRRPEAVHRPSRHAQGPRPDDRQEEGAGPLHPREPSPADGPRLVRDVRPPDPGGVPGPAEPRGRNPVHGCHGAEEAREAVSPVPARTSTWRYAGETPPTGLCANGR